MFVVVDVTMAIIYDRQFFFSANIISRYNKKIRTNNFLIVTFMFLVHISVPLLVLIRGTQRQFSLKSFETQFYAIWSAFKAL